MTRIETAEAFALAAPDGALLGLDPGTKTIGVAVCDENRSLASALETIRRTKLKNDVVRLREIIEHRNARGLVIGMPFNMNGSAGPRAQSVRAFTRSIEDAFGLPVLQWDERLSSFEANEVMKEAGLKPEKRDAVIDRVAAAVILQSAIDRLSAIRRSGGAVE